MKFRTIYRHLNIADKIAFWLLFPSFLLAGYLWGFILYISFLE